MLSAGDASTAVPDSADASAASNTADSSSTIPSSTDGRTGAPFFQCKTQLSGALALKAVQTTN